MSFHGLLGRGNVVEIDRLLPDEELIAEKLDCKGAGNELDEEVLVKVQDLLEAHILVVLQDDVPCVLHHDVRLRVQVQQVHQLSEVLVEFHLALELADGFLFKWLARAGNQPEKDEVDHELNCRVSRTNVPREVPLELSLNLLEDGFINRV